MTDINLKLDTKDVTYTIEAIPEDIPIRGNVMASGDDAYDKEAEDKIIADVENGNVWAWCTVEVTAHLGPYTGSTYLGCCSYESEEQFRKDSGSLDDMKREALAELLKNIEAEGATVSDENDAVEDPDVQLARDCMSSTLHGPLPLTTSMRLASAVVRLAEKLAAKSKTDKELFLDMVARADFFNCELREEESDDGTCVYVDAHDRGIRSGYIGFKAVVVFDLKGKLTAIGGIEE